MNPMSMDTNKTFKLNRVIRSRRLFALINGKPKWVSCHYVLINVFLCQNG